MNEQKRKFIIRFSSSDIAVHEIAEWKTWTIWKCVLNNVALEIKVNDFSKFGHKRTKSLKIEFPCHLIPKLAMWLGTCIECDWKISTTQFVKCNVCFGPGGHDSITLAASDADEKYWHVRINNCPTPAAATHVFIWRVGVCARELVLPWIWVSQMNTDMILSGKNISVTWHASQLNWFICRSNISTRTVFFSICFFVSSAGQCK